MAKRKAAMVQPSPAKAEDMLDIASTDLQLKLIETLRRMKNDRAYTVLAYHKTWAMVHFEGDPEPKAITYKEK